MSRRTRCLRWLHGLQTVLWKTKISLSSSCSVSRPASSQRRYPLLRWTRLKRKRPSKCSWSMSRKLKATCGTPSRRTTSRSASVYPCSMKTYFGVTTRRTSQRSLCIARVLRSRVSERRKQVVMQLRALILVKGHQQWWIESQTTSCIKSQFLRRAKSKSSHVMTRLSSFRRSGRRHPCLIRKS